MDLDEAVTFLARRLPESPSVFVAYTNALGDFPVDLESSMKFYCDEIPHFPHKEGQVPLHFLYGGVSGVKVLVLQGRYHNYEGFDQNEVTFPVRVARCLGCRRMLAVNAAGTVSDRFDLGDVMLVRSHVELHKNREKEAEENSKLYDEDSLRMAGKLAVEEGMDKYVKTGVYGMVGDEIPNYSEIYNWGIDAVGTSLVPEVLAASKLGMKVFGMSILTDKGILDYDRHPDPIPEDVSKAVEPKKPFVEKLMLRLIEDSV